MPDSLKFNNRNLHNNVVIIFKPLKTVQNVYFSYLEAGDIVYLSFLISKNNELEKWTNYPDLPYYEKGRGASYLDSIMKTMQSLKKVIAQVVLELF